MGKDFTDHVWTILLGYSFGQFFWEFQRLTIDSSEGEIAGIIQITD
jgi:hypothetical protein